MNADEFIEQVHAAWTPTEVHRLMSCHFQFVTGTPKQLEACINAADAKLERLCENGMELGTRGGRAMEEMTA
jgi:hypothetical protein